MHDHWFDVMVRALPGRGSRRGVLRGVGAVTTGVLAIPRGEGAVAHHGRIPLGGACRHTNQCLHHAIQFRIRWRRPSPQAVFCASNGFLYDGPLNCCRHAGGFCERDEQCCGTRHFCRNRVCTYLR